MTDFENGTVLLINKPINWSSFDIVNKIRINLKQNFGIKKIKVGHAGTLDPLADGLLIICTGKFTKRIEDFQAKEKEYIGRFFIGATTPSFDLEHEINCQYPVNHINNEMIYDASLKLKGKIKQIPPTYSAIKINGKRAYKYARNDQAVAIKEREVEISEFTITKIEMPYVDFKIVCSKGTYIRSIARDFGVLLNSGAYLAQLKRTRIGDFCLDKAISIDEWINSTKKISL